MTALPSRAELLAILEALPPEVIAELDSLILGNQDPWLPQPGPQTLAYYSEADELFFGGQAGGGKTDLILGLAISSHLNSIIFRREFPQLEAIIERSAELYSAYGKFNANKNSWRLFQGLRRVQFGAMQYVDSAMKYQGRPHDLKAYDEICHFTRYQYVFTKAWNRTVVPGQRCRVVAAGNPPTDAEGRWVVDYWAPWLSDGYHNPAEPGQLRFFITVDSKDYEVDGKGFFKFKGSTYESKSRTFIPSALSDNLFLAFTDYRSTLDTLPEPLRSQLLFGDFKAGMTDDAQQTIPTDWVRAAQARWTRRENLGPATQIGVDVSRGGIDKTIFSPRWGTYFGEQLPLKKDETDTGTKLAQKLITYEPRGSKTLVAIDIGGVGASAFDVTNDFAGIKAVPMNSANASAATDRSGMLGFVNARAEWWWKMREALEPEKGDDLAIPPDPELLADLCAPRWKLTARGIQIESKEDIKKKIKRSPDKGESLIYSHAQPSIPGQGLLDYYAEEYTDLQARLEEAKRKMEAGK